MAQKLEVNIQEMAQELKPLLPQQKSGRIKERVQILYGLKTQPTETGGPRLSLDKPIQR